MTAFLEHHSRAPWPEQVVWETSDPATSPGTGGIEILSLGATSSDLELVSPSLLRSSPELATLRALAPSLLDAPHATRTSP